MNKFVILLLLTMGPSFWVAANSWNNFITAPHYLTFLGLVLIFALATATITHQIRAAGANNRTVAGQARLRMPLSLRELDSLLFVVVALSAIHYWRLGEIPLFSASIDVLRFEISDSGLFGIPSRGATIGPILLLACVVAAWRTMSPRRRIVFVTAIVILSAFRGHKSALVEYLTYALLVVPWVVRADRAFLMGAAAVGAGLFIYFSSASYSTLETQYGFFDYIAARSALYQHDLVAFIMNSSLRYDLSQIMQELAYPALKVLNPSLQTLNQELSASYYGVQYGAFTVPVTPGPVGMSILINERVGVPVLAFATVTIPALLYHLRKRATDDRIVSALNFALFTLFVALSSGNFFYWISNSIASALIILSLAAIPLLLQRQTAADAPMVWR
jgi:hypothetical protein